MGHYLCEVEPDVFANNRASSYIDSGKAVSQLREASVAPIHEPRSNCHLTAPLFFANRPEKKYNDTNGIAAYVGTTYVEP